MGLAFPAMALATTGLAALTSSLVRSWDALGWRWDWRALYALTALLSAPLALALACWLPESPKFLALRQDPDVADESPLVAGPGIEKLFSVGHRRVTALLWLCWFCANFGMQSFNTFLPTLLDKNGISQTGEYAALAIYCAAGGAGCLLAGQLVELSTGRRVAMTIALASCSVSIAAFACVSTEVELVLLSCCFNVLANAAWAALYTFTPEVYPTELRCIGVGMASAMHSLAGIIAPYLAGLLVSSQPEVVVFSFAAATCIAALAAGLLPTSCETRGKQLADRIEEDAYRFEESLLVSDSDIDGLEWQHKNTELEKG